VSSRKDQGRPARNQRRPATPRQGFVGWTDWLARWMAVAMFALVALLVLIALLLDVRLTVALTGGAHRTSAIVYVAISVAAIVTLGLMTVMALSINLPDRLRLKPRTLDVIGTIVFYGMIFSFPLLVLSGGLTLAFGIVVAVGGWWIRIRGPLRDVLPITAGGRRPPGRTKKRRGRDEVASRPPRSWDPERGKAAAGSAKGGGSGSAGKRRRKGKKRRGA
jgi:hypothetical protein